MNANKIENAPPLGLKPRWIHDRQRLKDVCDAISHYWLAGLPLPVEWVIEYNDLVAASENFPREVND